MYNLILSLCFCHATNFSFEKAIQMAKSKVLGYESHIHESICCLPRDHMAKVWMYDTGTGE